jgi:hypothetical protein
MRIMATSKKHLCGGLLLVCICLLGSGCETMIGGAFDTLDHSHRVESYKEHGYSDAEARQKADFDQKMDKINNGE